MNVFNTSTLTKHFWKMKTFLKKLEYRFLVKSSKTENASFPYKTAISEVNVKTNRMVSTKWAYHKERSFAITNLFFRKLFSVQEPPVNNSFNVPVAQTPIFVLFLSVVVLFDSVFSLWVFLRRINALAVLQEHTTCTGK